jgi:hypothetical protein
MENARETTVIHEAVANPDAVVGVGAALSGHWASFGAPQETALGPEEAADILKDGRSDRKVEADLATIQRVLRLKWLGSETNRRFFVTTVLQAELRGLLKPTKEDGASITVTDEDGNLVIKMGHGMSPEELAEWLTEGQA